MLFIQSKKTALLTLACCLLGLTTATASPASKLIKRMKALQQTGIMVGHQDAPMYGHHWKWDEGRSDIKDIIGDYPAVMGFELGALELGHDKNLDQVPFDRMRLEIRRQHERGGIVELSWHPYNPVTGKNAWDPEGRPVKEILPGGSQHRKFNDWLHAVAQFLGSLRTADGKLIPVIFRPWHEMGGGWFWWGSNSCTPSEYKQLYTYTHRMLTKKYRLNNLVWGYSPNGGDEDFLRWYPGDKYVDLMGVDIYDFEADNDKYRANIARELSRLQQIGRQHRKLIALTETGAQQLPDSTWFTQVFWPAVKDYPISYVLFWRNAWDNHKETYMAYPGGPMEQDFRTFAGYGRTLFVNDINAKKDRNQNNTNIQ